MRGIDHAVVAHTETDVVRARQQFDLRVVSVQPVNRAVGRCVVMDDDLHAAMIDALLAEHRIDAIGKHPLAVVVGDADRYDRALRPGYGWVMNHCHVWRRPCSRFVAGCQPKWVRAAVLSSAMCCTSTRRAGSWIRCNGRPVVTSTASSKVFSEMLSPYEAL